MCQIDNVSFCINEPKKPLLCVYRIHIEYLLEWPVRQSTIHAYLLNYFLGKYDFVLVLVIQHVPGFDETLRVIRGNEVPRYLYLTETSAHPLHMLVYNSCIPLMNILMNFPHKLVQLLITCDVSGQIKDNLL